MTLEEHTLRELLASPHKQKVCNSLLSSISTGKAVTIKMENGTVFVLETPLQAMIVLQEYFGWTSAT
jgi:hypothetical protein